MKQYVLQSIIADDTSLIPYRKELNHLTGSVTATILLTQILYWWKNKKRTPFYKFRTPCGHGDYTPGDSWCEELGFGEKELDNAISAICEKVRETRKDKIQGNKEVRGYVRCWQTMDRKTYYEVNEELLEEDLKALFERLANPQNGDYVTTEKEISKPTKGGLDYIDTENTQKNTTEKETSISFPKADKKENKGTSIEKGRSNSMRGGADEATKQAFEEFRLYAKKVGMSGARGLETEYEYFTKKHKDYETVIPKLLTCLQAEVADREAKKKANQFVPAFKNFLTWVNKKAWETYETQEVQETSEPNILQMNPQQIADYIRAKIDSKEWTEEEGKAKYKYYQDNRPKKYG